VSAFVGDQFVKGQEAMLGRCSDLACIAYIAEYSHILQ